MALKYYNTGSANGFGCYGTATNWWTGTGRTGSSGLPASGDGAILESNICTLNACTISLSSICNQQTGPYAGGKTLCVDSTISITAGTSVFNNNSVISLSSNSIAKFCQTGGTLTLSGSCIIGCFNTTNGCFQTGPATFCAVNSLLSGGNFYSGNSSTTLLSGVTACANTIYSNINCIVWCNSINYSPMCVGYNSTGYKYICFSNSTNYATIAGCSSYTTGPSLCFTNKSNNCNTINNIGTSQGCICFINCSNNYGFISSSTALFTLSSNNNSSITCCSNVVTFCCYSNNNGNIDNVGCFVCYSNNNGCLFANGYGSTTNYALFNYNSNNNCCVNGACKVVFCNNSYNNCNVNINGNSAGGTICFYDTSINYGNICDGYCTIACFFGTSNNQGYLNANCCVYFAGIGSNGVGGNLYGTINSTGIVTFCGTDNNGVICGPTTCVCFFNGSATYGSNNNNCIVGNARFGSGNLSPSVNYGTVTGNTNFTGCCASNQGTVGGSSTTALFSCSTNAGVACGNITFAGSINAINCGTTCGCTCFSNPAWNYGTVIGDTYFSSSNLLCSQYLCSLCQNNCHCGNICFGFPGPSLAFPVGYANYQFLVNMTPGNNYLDYNGIAFSCLCTNGCGMSIQGNTLNNRSGLTCVIIKANDALGPGNSGSGGGNQCVNLPTNGSTILMCCLNGSNTPAICSFTSVAVCNIIYQPSVYSCYDSCVVICSPNITFYSSGTNGCANGWGFGTYPGIYVDNFSSNPTIAIGNRTRYYGTVCFLGTNTTGNSLSTLGYFCQSNNAGLNLSVYGTICGPGGIITNLVLNGGGITQPDVYTGHVPYNSISSVNVCNGIIQTSIAASCNNNCIANVYLYGGSSICATGSRTDFGSNECITIKNAIFINNTNAAQYQNGFIVLSALQYCNSSNSCISNRSFITSGTNFFGVNALGCVLDSSSNTVSSFVFRNTAYNTGTIPVKTYFYDNSFNYNTGIISTSAIHYGQSINGGYACNVVFNECSFNGSGGRYTNLIAYNSLQKGIYGSYILGPAFKRIY